MFGITDLGTYIIGVIAVILLPGPNSMFCLSAATQYGIRSAYVTVAAIVLGDSILMLASVFGAGALLRTNPQLFIWFKYIGATYLAYIGIQLCHQAIKQWQTPPHTTKLKKALPKPRKLFAKALTLSLSNPKAILFFISFFIQFVRSDYPRPYLSFLILGIILQCVSVMYLSLLIISGTTLIHWFYHHKQIGILGIGGIGILFLGFATTLLTTHLT